MCGIAGIVSINGEPLNKEFLLRVSRELLLNIEHRGKDATGFVAVEIKKDGAHGTTMLKDGVTASSFVLKPTFSDTINASNAHFILLHTRASTKGTALNNDNNHPFLSPDGSALIHNGMIYNDDEVKKEQSLLTVGECDTEVMFSLIRKFKGDVRRAYSKLEGSASVAYWNATTAKLTLARDSNPLYVALFPSQNALLFASTPDALSDALGSGYDTFRKYGLSFERPRTETLSIPIASLQDCNALEIAFNDSGAFIHTLKGFKLKEYHYVAQHSRGLHGVRGIADVSSLTTTAWKEGDTIERDAKHDYLEALKEEYEGEGSSDYWGTTNSNIWRSHGG